MQTVLERHCWQLATPVEQGLQRYDVPESVKDHSLHFVHFEIESQRVQLTNDTEQFVQILLAVALT